MVIVRWGTDCQAVAGAASPPVGAEHASAKLTRPKRMAFWFYRCVLAIQLSACADATAQRSVAHLTITNAKKLV
ncbi:MAG: hypothetical protein LBQ66_03920 [Planctomycetaceae bacterium]|nr:hypothetical protein [Planctomycetaceae bacterium]